VSPLATAFNAYSTYNSFPFELKVVNAKSVILVFKKIIEIGNTGVG